MSRSNGCREWLWAALLVAFAAGAAGCHSEGEAPEGAAEQTVATVVTAPVARGPVQQTVETYGVVEFDPHRARSVAFVKAGQVLQVLVTPGQQVRQGEPLVTLGPIPGDPSRSRRRASTWSLRSVTWSAPAACGRRSSRPTSRCSRPRRTSPRRARSSKGWA